MEKKSTLNSREENSSAANAGDRTHNLQITTALYHRTVSPSITKTCLLDSTLQPGVGYTEVCKLRYFIRINPSLHFAHTPHIICTSPYQGFMHNRFPLLDPKELDHSNDMYFDDNTFLTEANKAAVCTCVCVMY